MSTFAILTVGFNEFLMPANEAQKCFEVLSGRGINVGYVSAAEAEAAGTTRGDTLSQTEHRTCFDLLDQITPTN
mgnify:CR=1 FL=1